MCKKEEAAAKNRANEQHNNRDNGQQLNQSATSPATLARVRTYRRNILRVCNVRIVILFR